MDGTTDNLSGARELADGVFVFTSGAYAMNSGAVLAGAGSLLVDPGYFPAELGRIAAFLDARGADPRRIVLTHSDWDHVAGTARWPDAQVIASAAYPARAASDGARITRSLEEFDRRLYVRREPPFAIPAPAILAGSPSELVWEGPRTRLLPAGGHTPDGLMLLLRDQRVLFAGDHLSDLEIPFVGDSFDAYRGTLLAVRTLVLAGDVETLVPGHGDPCGRDEILARLEEDADYLDRLIVWVRETARTVRTLAGLHDRADEVVYRKGAGNPDVRAEHLSNIALAARLAGIE
jgi:glyoxylase-like metal-dependent hydrolase (beta-lactamase superfamily II)